jgi:hypothetical protein
MRASVATAAVGIAVGSAAGMAGALDSTGSNIALK